jgi:hypothetical protein
MANEDAGSDPGVGLMAILGRIEPQPPRGIKYMLGNESWLPPEQRTLLRLHCEEWGNLGPMELNPEIKPNKAGLRVRCTSIEAPDGACGFEEVDGIYYWSDRSWPNGEAP